MDSLNDRGAKPPPYKDFNNSVKLLYIIDIEELYMDVFDNSVKLFIIEELYMDVFDNSVKLLYRIFVIDIFHSFKEIVI